MFSLSSRFTHLQMGLSLHQHLGSFQQSTGRAETRPRGQQPAGQPGAPGAPSQGWHGLQGVGSQTGTPRGHTCYPKEQQREEPCPIRHPLPVRRTGLQITSGASGGERQLFISRLEVRRYSATPLHFQYLLPSRLFLGLFHPFCPRLSEKKKSVRDGLPPATAQCTQHLQSFAASCHGAEGVWKCCKSHGIPGPVWKCEWGWALAPASPPRAEPQCCIEQPYMIWLIE